LSLVVLSPLQLKPDLFSSIENYANNDEPSK